MAKQLYIVESPTKARTLKRFLPRDSLVESSVGHIRDLPASASEIPAAMKKEPWARLGVNVEKDFRPLYVVHSDKKKKIQELKARLKEAEELILATDEDREGEAISWHLVEVLKPKIRTRRMVFHEITREAIHEALEQTREIDQNLVAAQEARRIIDRLYGYEVSPILWRKIAPRLSAGRVQSVAIRMLVDREQARMRFRAAHYWDLAAVFATREGSTFPARLVSVGGARLAGGKDFDPDTGAPNREGIVVLDGERARHLVEALRRDDFSIVSTDERPYTQSPPPPFTTSTLQQEGGRKLRFDAKRTMRAAQRLYENGLITYMRTDSTALAGEAIRASRSVIERLYGREYLPEKPRVYASKVKNAQEAHEAIRPAGEAWPAPGNLPANLSDDERRLYEMIWKRTVACQMQNARGRRMTVRVGSRAEAEEVIFQANGTAIDFAGFLRAYVEGSDDPEAALADRETLLPHVKEGDSVSLRSLEAEDHVTQPPPRLTEASLVKALEESGIGRPSTYASIIDTIERREYSFKKGAALVPTFTAFAVVNLMRDHLADLIDLEFTARMEDRLDSIARGEGEPLPYLKEFYFGNGAPGLRPLLDRKVADIDPRHACTIPIGAGEGGEEIVVRVGRYGPYLQKGETTVAVPDGTAPDELSPERAEELLAAGALAEEPIGSHPETGAPIYVKSGRFGPYVQLGDGGDGEAKPKMVSLLPRMSPDTLTLEDAVALLSLPRSLGVDPEGREVVAHYGRYGAYIKRNEETRSLGPEDDVLTVTLERALEVLAQEKRGRRFRAAPQPLKVFENAIEGREIRLLTGRFGPYVTDGEVNASLPRSMTDPTALTPEEAVRLIKERRARGPSKPRATRRRSSASRGGPKTTSGKPARKKSGKAKTKRAGSGRTSSKKAPRKKTSGKGSGTQRSSE